MKTSQQPPADKNQLNKTPSDNLYENVIIQGKRARQLAAEHTRQMQDTIEQLGPYYSDNDVFDKTRSDLVDEFDKKSKPIEIASNEWKEGKILYAYRPEKKEAAEELKDESVA